MLISELRDDDIENKQVVGSNPTLRHYFVTDLESAEERGGGVEVVV